MPDVVIIAGPNGAGKSTLAPALARDTFGILDYVNVDTIAKGLSAFAPENASVQTEMVFRERLGKLSGGRRSFAFESTLSSDQLAPWLEKIKKKNFYVSIVFLWLENVEIGIERVRLRDISVGNSIKEDLITRRHRKGLINFRNTYMKMADAWQVFDASRLYPTEIAGYTHRNGLQISDDVLWQRFVKKKARE
jgi:predicted ABC-type ATPase